MRTDKLYVGLILKNYKDLCNFLEIQLKKGTNSRDAQFKELSRYCMLEKNGHQIIIKEIYDTPLPKIDSRGKDPNSRYGNKYKIPLTVSNPKLAEQWLVEENGMELNDYITRTVNVEFWWKCSNCHHKIFSAPHKRFNKTKGYKDEFITCPYCNLSKGAKIVYDYLEYLNISFKLEYMFDGLLGLGNKKLRFDFALFDNENKLITLIEYDGGYHDEELNPNIQNHKIVAAHDILKDKYCDKNNIPLLRIHHTRMDEIKVILINYLAKLDVPFIKNCNENIIDLIINYEDKKKLIQEELSKLEETINYFKSMLV